jgi:hypothetical protein
MSAPAPGQTNEQRMPKKPKRPPSEDHRPKQVPPKGATSRPDPAPDSLGQEGEQSTIKPNTTGPDKQDRA